MTNLLIQNAKIFTQDPGQPWAESVLVLNGRIVAAGPTEQTLKLAPDGTPTIDVGKRLILPAFTDAHIHFHDIAQRRGQLELYAASSLEDALDRIARHAAALPPEAWVLGYGWNESNWPEPRFPNRYDLDPITGGRPAIFWRTDLHVAVANSAALQAAAIDAETPDPPSGVIDREADGQTTGVLRELAINLVRQVIPTPDEATATANLLATAAELHRLGIVAVHDQRMKDHDEEGRQALRLFTRLHSQGRLPLRVTCNIEAGNIDHLIELGLESGFGNEWVRLGHVKLFADGSLGARTAWMLEAYEGDPENCGMFLTSPDEVARVIQRAHRHGLSISIHAIGDRANREVLDIFEETLAAGSEHPPLLPHRIEHVQTLQPDDWSRLAVLGITASVQPIHCTDDFPNTDLLWGVRGRNTYAFRSLLDAGTTLAFGSDAPVASINPWWGIHAAVTRQRGEGSPSDGWHPEQRLTVSEAVKAYTLGPAIATGQDHQQGRIAPTYLADFIVLDRDIFTCAPVDIRATQVELTILGGEVVYPVLHVERM